MGLDTTHNAWHGPYSSFNDFRRSIIKAYNDTDLFEYEGYESRCKKDLDKPSPSTPLTNIEDRGLFLLSDHSDCEGDIKWADCGLLANSIVKLFTKLPAYQLDNARQFVKGLRLANRKKQDLIFG